MADRPPIAELLKKNATFNHLQAEELEELAKITSFKSYAKGELVFSREEEAHYIFLVVNGAFTLHLQQQAYKVFKPFEIFGEIAVLNKQVRTGAVRAQSDALVLAICGTRLFASDHISASTALKVVRALAIKITNYLRTREDISTKELVEGGETEFVEFKSTLRWNKQTNRKDRVIEHAALKTIAAFLNAKGGTLLVGVNDDQEILGLKEDQFVNEDKMLLHLTKLIKDRISPLHIDFVKYSVEPLDDKQVLRIDCQAATLPAYLIDRGDEHFYVRTGPASTSLKLSRVHRYIKMRFEQSSEPS
ncbi:MAG: RNA-binding domain-containing protein [Bacteroidota bacterium]